MEAMRPALGYVGVGAMGLPMARNLLRAGYALSFCTRRDAVADELVAEGGRRVGDPAEVAAASEVVLTCLPADAEIAAVCLDEGGLLDALREGGVLIADDITENTAMAEFAEAHDRAPIPIGAKMAFLVK
jgi:2-hydroxy-3-oxopropionate reductase